jgi:NitT/TauT family transport system permease protein
MSGDTATAAPGRVEIQYDDAELRPPSFLRRARGTILPVAFILLVIGVWEAITELTSAFPQYLLPSPSSIVTRMYDTPELLWSATRVTLVEIVVGFAIGTVIGLALALPIAYSDTVRATLYPLIVASQAVPKIAIGPLLVLWLGLGSLPKLAIVAMMVFFPIVITAAEGFSSVDRNLLDLLRSVNAGQWEIFRRVRFPHALPQIFSGLKIGITLAVVGAVVGEWIGADNGLGYLLLQANTQLDSTLLFSALVLLVLLGVVLFILVEIAERVLLPWRRSSFGDVPLAAS